MKDPMLARRPGGVGLDIGLEATGQPRPENLSDDVADDGSSSSCMIKFPEA